MKILLQRVLEAKIEWDDPVPEEIQDSWRSELVVLSSKRIPRCYFPKDAHIVSMQLHGFSDASEVAYAGVVYLRMVDTTHRIHVSLVLSKTKVAPIRRLTIPRLELCGAHLLTGLLHHVKDVLGISLLISSSLGRTAWLFLDGLLEIPADSRRLWETGFLR